MKKIMFNDSIGLTQAVLSGRKIMTRRIIPRDFFTLQWDEREDTLVCEDDMGDFIDVRETRYAQYKVGEVVAVAQSYEDCTKECIKTTGLKVITKPHLAKVPGYKNKMFVRADLMPHRIRITGVRVERLQDISDEDCIKEGIETMESYAIRADGTKKTLNYFRIAYRCKSGRVLTLSGSTPREAYAALIDRISGKGVFQSNPYVFVYDFILIK